MMAHRQDDIALAAEYALGTLDADERAQVETMMSRDKDFTAIVEAWEYKLGILNQMVGSIEPPAEVWNKIKTAVGHAEPQSPLLHGEDQRYEADHHQGRVVVVLHLQVHLPVGGEPGEQGRHHHQDQR